MGLVPYNTWVFEKASGENKYYNIISVLLYKLTFFKTSILEIKKISLAPNEKYWHAHLQ